MIVSDLPTPLQDEQVSDIQFTVGAAVVVSCLRSCLGLGVTTGRCFKMSSLFRSFGSLGLSEDREMKGKEEEHHHHHRLTHRHKQL